MRKQKQQNQVTEEQVAEYFAQARKLKCPPSMKQNLYQKIGLKQSSGWQQSQWFKPVLAFSFVAVFSLGLVWQNHNQIQQQQLAEAERDMQIAMHYMQKISAKTMEDVNTHGIKPAIIVPVSKSMAQI
jgi:protoheme ferro-lyase